MKTLTRETLKIYLKHSLRYRWVLSVIVGGIVVGTVADALVPLAYKKFFDALSTGPGVAYEQILPAVWLVFAFGVASWLGWRVATFFNNFFQPRVMVDLVNTCFEYLQDHSYGFFTDSFTGSLVKKVTRYANAYEDISDQFFWSMGPILIRIITMLVVLYERLWILAAGFLLWTVVYMAFNYKFTLYKLPYDIRSAAADTEVGAHLADTVTNNINLKLFGGRSREIAAHKKITQKLFLFRKISWDLSSIVEAGQAGLMVIFELAMLLLAVKYWKMGILTLGDFALIQGYLLQIFGRLWDFGRNIRRIYQRLADADEMTEILETPHEVRDAPRAGEMSVREGLIEFSKVNFAYAKAGEVLQDFSLTVKPSERVALIGPSGGGKSTIVKLLFRFYDIQGGKITIDGQDIAKVSQASLREALALVPQEPILFHRSLMENIRYARPSASDEDVIVAAKAAHCHEFISAFPEGYQTFVGERGVKLSGGERQRVAIARAILKNAPILVLDEATSSLDSESERYIQDALRALMQGRTTIVIAHRLSTIMQMDRIIVLEAGKVIEEGKHKELLKVKKGLYQKLWHIQAGGFSV
ncbi:MAG: ABC transporter ATP-binding protein/permease [Patescibacteria group bacterium]|nr:ABC transporter ATP-binding protein/permease [Patescibacteria group bacterium]